MFVTLNFHIRLWTHDHCLDQPDKAPLRRSKVKSGLSDFVQCVSSLPYGLVIDASTIKRNEERNKGKKKEGKKEEKRKEGKKKKESKRALQVLRDGGTCRDCHDNG